MKQILTKKTFLAYLTVGDGGLQYSLDTALAFVEGGVDVIEIGLPFTDPVADGPTIQQAMDRSLKVGTTPETLMRFVERFRQHTDTPLVLFSYYNPILQMGEDYLKALKGLGVDAMILVDVPHTEILHLNRIMETIPIITPSSTDERIATCTQQPTSFIYYACQRGTTGARTEIPTQATTDIERIRSLSSLPIIGGFGISNREMASKLLEVADGFVVGSHFVNAMAQKISPSEMVQLVKEIDPRN